MRDPRGLVDRVEVPSLNGVHFEAVREADRNSSTGVWAQA